MTPYGEGLEWNEDGSLESLEILFPEQAHSIYELARAEALYWRDDCYKALVILVSKIPFLKEKQDMRLLFAAMTLEVYILVINAQAAPGRPGQGGWGDSGSYGTYLGWEYSTVSEKSSGGFNLSDPAGSDSHLGDKVTVYYRASEDGALVEWTEGSVNDETGRNVLSSGSTGQVIV